MTVGEISQTISSLNFTVQNSVQFSGPLAKSSISTNAKFEVRSPKRVQVYGFPMLRGVTRDVNFAGKSTKNVKKKRIKPKEVKFL